MDSKLKRYFRSLRFKELQKDIRGWRLDLPLAKYVGIFVALTAALFGIGQFLSMNIWGMLFVFASFFFIMPKTMRAMYKAKYEKNKFLEVSNYMEQMLYSFKRTPKILDALQDVQRLYPNTEIGDGITEAIAYIQTGYYTKNLYAEAFAFIERTHFCRPLASIHSFMTSVEITGGEYVAPADNLLMDRSAWVQRTTDSNNKKQGLKMQMAICTALAIFILGITVIMNNVSGVGQMDSFASQAITAGCLFTDVFMWSVLVKKLDGSWINRSDRITDERVDKYTYLMKNPNRIKPVKIIMLLGIGAIFGGVIYFTTKNLIYVGIVVVFVLFVIIQPLMQNNTANKTIKREAAAAFAEWMMLIALELQTATVAVALINTLQTAPYIIKVELEKMLKALEEDPLGMQPYMDFYAILDNTDIQTSMRSLYSMAQYGSEDMQRQIYGMLERNSSLQDKAEKSAAETEQAAYGVILYAPILVGAVKLLADMMFTMTGIMDMAGM